MAMTEEEVDRIKALFLRQVRDLTPDEFQEVKTILQRVLEMADREGRGKEYVAGLLGISDGHLEDLLRHDQDLANRWIVKTKRDDIDSAGSFGTAKTADDGKLILEAGLDPDISFKKNLLKMGLTPAEVELGHSLRDMNAEHLGDVIGASNAGVFRNQLNLHTEFDAIMWRLRGVRAALTELPAGSQERLNMANEESFLATHLSNISDIIRKQSETLNRSGAIVVLLQRSANKKKTKSMAYAQPSDLK